MYHHIYVPIDNSDWSNRAIDVAVELGKAFGAKLTGCHVYAARLHDYRFKQMEYTLPQEYKYEAELERQRKIHDSLIALGLQRSGTAAVATCSPPATDRTPKIKRRFKLSERRASTRLPPRGGNSCPRITSSQRYSPSATGRS